MYRDSIAAYSLLAPYCKEHYQTSPGVVKRLKGDAMTPPIVAVTVSGLPMEAIVHAVESALALVAMPEPLAQA